VSVFKFLPSDNHIANPLPREMAVGNTFGATALSSYGGFWIAYGILLTPNWNILGQGGPYATQAATAIDPKMGASAVGFFLTGWFIFTTILLLCTLRSTVMFFMLFFTLDLAFLMLACGEFAANNGTTEIAHKLTQAGGGFGMIAAFLAWYNAFAGIADSRYVMTVSFFPAHSASFLFCPAKTTQHPCRVSVWLRERAALHRPSSAGRHMRQAKKSPSNCSRCVPGFLCAANMHITQQFVLPYSRLPLPVVGEGARGQNGRKDRPRECLNHHSIMTLLLDIC